MNPFVALALGFFVGLLFQAWRTSRKLNCSISSVIKSGGGPGEGDDP